MGWALLLCGRQSENLLSLGLSVNIGSPPLSSTLGVADSRSDPSFTSSQEFFFFFFFFFDLNEGKGSEDFLSTMGSLARR
jgi:hypothetical protein